MVTMQPKTFNSTPQVVARLMPFNVPPPLCETGPVIGYNLITRRPERFNPWELRMKNVIIATVFRVIATLGGGKTALYMMLALRLMEMAAGVDVDGNPRQMRGRIEENKHEKKESAFAQFSRVAAATVYQMDQLKAINPYAFNQGMTELDLLARVLRTAEIQNYGAPLSPLAAYAFQVATHLMYQRPDLCGPDYLYYLLSTADFNDAKAYSNHVYGSFMESNRQLFAENETLRDEIIARQERDVQNLTAGEFRLGCRDAMLFPDRMLRGDYGSVFGQQNGIKDIMADQVAVLDWLNVPDIARTIITSAMWQEQTISTRNSDQADLVPNFVFTDEGGKAAANLSLTEYYAAASKDARAFPTLVMEATQFEKEDLVQVGEENSRARALASARERAVGGRLLGPIGKLNPQVLAYCAEMGIEEHEAFFMSGMPPGCFALVIPNQPVRFIQVIPRPTERPIIQSDGEAEQMTSFNGSTLYTPDEIIANAVRINAEPDQ